MNIHKLTTSRPLFLTLLLTVAVLMSSIAFCQTSTTQPTKLYSTAQAPDLPSEPSSNDELVKLLLEQNHRLKEENAQLKAEIEVLKQRK